MFKRTVEILQDQRVKIFLTDYLAANPRWYRSQSGEIGRFYKRDDDLADDFWAEAAFRPVAESFYLQTPSNSRLGTMATRNAPALNPELITLLMNALRILAKRLKQEPGLLPLTRRLATTPTGNPSTSTMNFPRGDTRANGITTALGPGGNLSVIYVGGGATTSDIVFDVTGYFVP